MKNYSIVDKKNGYPITTKEYNMFLLNQEHIITSNEDIILCKSAEVYYNGETMRPVMVAYTAIDADMALVNSKKGEKMIVSWLERRGLECLNEAPKEYPKYIHWSYGSRRSHKGYNFGYTL